MMIRNICEAYPGISPPEVESWGLDHIYMLGIDRKMLERLTGALVSGTPEELAARGVIPREHETLLQKLKREKIEQKQQSERSKRRQRKLEKRAAAIAYKQSRGE